MENETALHTWEPKERKSRKVLVSFEIEVLVLQDADELCKQSRTKRSKLFRNCIDFALSQPKFRRAMLELGS